MQCHMQGGWAVQHFPFLQARSWVNAGHAVGLSPWLVEATLALALLQLCSSILRLHFPTFPGAHIGLQT